VTVAGTVIIPPGDAVTFTIVSVDCDAEIVTVNIPVAPRVTGSVGGCSETTVGNAGVTVTVLIALVPLRLAVMSTVPGVFAVTVTGAVVWPVGITTLLGTEAIEGVVLVSVTLVSLSCAELIVTVNVPVAPCVIDSLLGSRLVIVGGCGVTCTVLLAVPPLRETVIWD
jgi:hypothetical protein